MLYYLRHGQTDFNIGKIKRERVDVPINEEGRRQAEIAAEELKGIKFDAVFCSPYLRTRQTAEIVTDLEPVIDERVREVDLGSARDIELEHEEWRELYKNWLRGERDERFFDAETISEIRARAYDFVGMLRRDYGGKNVLVVAHGGVGRFIACCFIGHPADGDYTKCDLKIKNCEVLKFDF